MQISTSNDPVFVFGSNLAGRHGKGAALWARLHRGAIYGRGVARRETPTPFRPRTASYASFRCR